jgi:hypothetical protein
MASRLCLRIISTNHVNLLTKQEKEINVLRRKKNCYIVKSVAESRATHLKMLGHGRDSATLLKIDRLPRRGGKEI